MEIRQVSYWEWEALMRNTSFFLLGKSLGFIHGHLGYASEGTPCSSDLDLPYSCRCSLPHQMDTEKSQFTEGLQWAASWNLRQAPRSRWPEEIWKVYHKDGTTSSKINHNPKLPRLKSQFPRSSPKLTSLCRSHSRSPKPSQLSKDLTWKPVYAWTLCRS